MRIDGRKYDELRPVKIIPDYLQYPEGSALITLGKTIVLCTATIEETIPRWMQLQGKMGGWVTAEYSLLPRSTQTRTPRETMGLGGRTQEIRRFIGRSLRASINLTNLGQRTCIVDCDVIQADGGTRVAGITGGFVALAIAVNKLISTGVIPESTINFPIAAVSLGLRKGLPLLDLCYQEDASIDVDINVVINSKGELIELECTSENRPFSQKELIDVINLAYKGVGELFSIQNQVLHKYISDYNRFFEP